MGDGAEVVRRAEHWSARVEGERKRGRRQPTARGTVHTFFSSAVSNEGFGKQEELRVVTWCWRLISLPYLLSTPCEGGSCRRTARECHGIDDCGSEQFAPSGRRVLAMVDLAQCVGIRLRRQPPSAEGDGIPTTWMHVRASPAAVERGWFGSVAEAAPAFLVLRRLFRLSW